MALTKQVTTLYGPSVNANYHNICEVNWRKGAAISVQLAGYASKADRKTDGVIPLIRITEILPAVEIMPTFSELYAAIKELPDWANAQDA